MNECCRKTLQAYQDRLAQQAEQLIHVAGDQTSTFQQAIARRAEILVDVMADLKAWVSSSSVK